MSSPHAKIKRLPRRPADAPAKPAILMRAPDDLMAWLASASSNLGVSQNALMVAAVEELRRVLELIERGDADNVSPDDLFEAVGHGWCNRLLAAGVRHDRLRTGFNDWMQGRWETRREIEADKLDRRRKAARDGNA